MNFIGQLIRIAAAAALASSAWAQQGFPFQNETLHYDINWPSGLGIGEATFTAGKVEAGWKFGMDLNAGIPGFTVADKIRSTASTDLCSAELDRDLSHASRKSREKTTFDQQRGFAERVTVFPEDGGKTKLDIPACARDALTFLYFVRKELGQGRVAPPQQVYFGSAYSVRLEYVGAQSITSREKQVTADRVTISFKGPKSDLTFEAFFARDPARTPLSIRVPLSAGAFSMDLTQ